MTGTRLLGQQERSRGVSLGFRLRLVRISVVEMAELRAPYRARIRTAGV